MMQENDAKFLRGVFKKYYFDHFDLISIPDRIREREFGFQKFDSGMIRHISLKSDRELRLLLMQEIPSDMYCSNAYYSFPDLPMKEKDWKEADVIFDIDAKDLKLPCRPDHTAVLCTECRAAHPSGSSCPSCGSAKLESVSLPCRSCIDSSKAQVERLSDMLVHDFAVERSSIRVYFSGNEGFHIYVHGSQFQQCGSRERAELVDYLMLNGAIPETFGMKPNKPDKQSLPESGQPGWRGRFASEVYGSKSNRPKAVKKLVSGGYQAFFQTIAELSGKMGAKIDPGVTMDVHRIFRLPGSLNSKSGLAKVPCSDLGSFNPYVDASFLPGDAVQIRADCPHAFRLQRKKFGPYKDELVTVPAYAAAYMICKKLAKIQ